MGLGGVSVLFIVGFVLCVIGTILHIIGLATPEWSVYDTAAGVVTAGLFRDCAGSSCSDVDLDNASADDYRAAQAMNIIGILLAFACLIVAIVHLVMGCMSKEPMKMLPLVAGVLGIVAFIFILIGVAVWGGAIHDDELSGVDPDIGYSFILSIIGGIVILIGGILLLVGNMTSIGAS